MKQTVMDSCTHTLLLESHDTELDSNMALDLGLDFKGDEVSMDSAVWSGLPEHLTERVLARLPIQSFFRCRVVCKAWNCLMYSSSFIQGYAEVASHWPCFLFFVDDECRAACAYDHTLNKWYRFPLPRFPLIFDRFAADGGLVVFFSYGWQTLVVCNPLTKCWRELSPMRKKLQVLDTLAMVVDRDTKAYKIVVAGRFKTRRFGTLCRITEVYNSATKLWTKQGKMPAPYQPMQTSTIHCNGVLYVRCRKQDGLLVYDLQKGQWNHIQSPMPHSSKCFGLVECRGRVCIVGGQRENDLTLSIRIWKLQHTTWDWREVDRMPSALFEDIQSIVQYHKGLFTCYGCGDFILLTVHDYLPYSPFRVLVYDLSRKRWHEWASVPRAVEFWVSDHLLREGASFEPGWML